MDKETSAARFRGIAMVLTGAALWGISGTVAQFLFQQHGFTAEWLVVIRLLVSGILLLLVAYPKEKSNIWAVWKEPRDAVSLLLFSILGMLAVQYTYFAAIVHSNAATATFLQYLGPVMITLFVAVRMKRLPSMKETLAVVFAVLGTFFLVTNGNWHTISLSSWALFWGLSSAAALAFYTLQPLHLLQKWGSMMIVGWGMLIGGAGFSLLYPPWVFSGRWSFPTVLAVVFVVLLGTLIAFYLYLESLKYLSATETSLLASIEPLSAAFSSIVWLGVAFGFAEWIGALCILSTVFILSLRKKRNQIAGG